jgi:hypothetical protein
MGKGGGKQSSTSQVYQSTLPKYAEPYYHSLMDRAQAESQRPYQTYEGQRIADQTAQTTAGMNMAQQFATSGAGDLDNARSLANTVAQGAVDLQNYQAGGVNNTYMGPADWQAGQFTADQVRTGEFDAAARDRYMSPYMDAVTAAAQRDAQEKAMEEMTMLRSQQGLTGGFGGSRAAVQQQMAANAAQQRISDIGVQGRQAAFENAQQQFERDQGRGLQAQLANQAKNLEALGMGESSRQFGYAQGEEGRRAASELGMQAQSQTEQLRQAGKQLGLQGLQLAGNTASQMADFQKLSDSMQMQRFQTMLGIGQMQEDRQQRALDLAYEDFQNQVNWPRQNLSFVSSMLASQPMGTNQSITTSSPQNNIAGMAGTAMGLQALYNLGRGTSS